MDLGVPVFKYTGIKRIELLVLQSTLSDFLLVVLLHVAVHVW